MPKPLKLFVLAGLLLAITGVARAQCGNKVNLVDTGNSSFSIQVESDSRYTGQVIAFKNVEKVTVREFETNRSGRFTFEKLDPEMMYRVVITFTGTDEFLCRSKVLDGIILTNNSQSGR